MSAHPTAHVIGDPIAHSKSPVIHRFWLEKLGLEGTYDAVRVGESELASYLSEARNGTDWRGCNVTMPHKQAILPLLDSLDPLTERLGAVNTVVRQKDASLRGFNTDVGGFLEPLRAFLAKSHLFRMARIIGTGGAARAIAAGLSDKGCVLVVAGRDTQKAAALLEDVATGSDHHVAPLSHFAKPTDFVFDDRKGCFDLVVNASPLGMRGRDALAFDFSHAPPGSIFYDIVTDPADTPFLTSARAKGFATVGGLSMLIGQAAEAFGLLFGQEAPREYDAELRERLTA